MRTVTSTRIVKVTYPNEQGVEVTTYHGPFTSTEHFCAWFDEQEVEYGLEARFEILPLSFPEMPDPKTSPPVRSSKQAASSRGGAT